MSTRRIYKVTHLKELISKQQEVLVESESKGGALRHVAEKCLSVELASQFDLIRLTQDGVKVEAAKVAPEEPPIEEGAANGKAKKKVWA